MYRDDYDDYDKVVTLVELSTKVDEEYKNMSDEERYRRLRDCEPTFLQNCCSFMSCNKLEKCLINEFTYKCERITESFEYSDIDSFSYILPMTTNNKSSEYIKTIKTVDKNDSNISLQKFRFQNHLINWQNKTMFLSSTKEIIENKDFQAIVAMGYTAVPYILESIENEPSTLVWALNFIYNRKISNNPNTTISEACKLWTKWYKNI